MRSEGIKFGMNTFHRPDFSYPRTMPEIVKKQDSRNELDLVKNLYF